MIIPKEIQEAIIKNKLVIFAGAGFSLKFDLPNWQKLVEDVIAEIDNEEYKTLLPVLRANLMSPVQVLELLHNEHNVIKRYLIKNFKIDSEDLNLHRKVLRLSNSIITTNFDNAFELASDNKIEPAIYTSDFNISEINKSDDPYIFKLHGTYSEPDNCILFKEQYENLYLNDTAAKEKLKSIFAEKTILFIGYSFNDPDINLIFDNLN